MARDFLSDYVFITVGRVGSASELISQQVLYAGDVKQKAAPAGPSETPPAMSHPRHASHASPHSTHPSLSAREHARMNLTHALYAMHHIGAVIFVCHVRCVRYADRVCFVQHICHACWGYRACRVVQALVVLSHVMSASCPAEVWPVQGCRASKLGYRVQGPGNRKRKRQGVGGPCADVEPSQPVAGWSLALQAQGPAEACVGTSPGSVVQGRGLIHFGSSEIRGRRVSPAWTVAGLRVLALQRRRRRLGLSFVGPGVWA